MSLNADFRFFGVDISPLFEKTSEPIWKELDLDTRIYKTSKHTFRRLIESSDKPFILACVKYLCKDNSNVLFTDATRLLNAIYQNKRLPYVTTNGRFFIDDVLFYEFVGERFDYLARLANKKSLSNLERHFPDILEMRKKFRIKKDLFIAEMTMLDLKTIPFSSMGQIALGTHYQNLGKFEYAEECYTFSYKLRDPRGIAKLIHLYSSFNKNVDLIEDLFKKGAESNNLEFKLKYGIYILNKAKKYFYPTWLGWNSAQIIEKEKWNYKQIKQLLSHVKKKDLERGIRWIKEAALEHLAEACYFYGIYVLKFLKLPRYPISFFSEAALKGHVFAITEKGVCYQNGYGVKANNKKAVQCYKKAIKKGKDPRAYKKLAYCYKKGLGVKQNETKAKNLKKLARDVF